MYVVLRRPEKVNTVQATPLRGIPDVPVVAESVKAPRMPEFAVFHQSAGKSIEKTAGEWYILQLSSMCADYSGKVDYARSVLNFT